MPLVWSCIQPLGRGWTFRNLNHQGWKRSPAPATLGETVAPSHQL